MAEIKSSELVSSLSKSEFKLFDQYLKSPYFGCAGEISALFSNLILSKQITKEDIYSKIYPGKKYDDKQMRYLISDLNKNIEYFIMLRQLEQHPLHEKLLVAEALSVRNCKKAYALKHREISDKTNFQNARSYMQQYEHAEMHMNFINRDANRKTTPDYTSTLLHLDSFFIIKKLQLACEVTNLANILKKQYDIVMLDEIRKNAGNKPFCDMPHIAIYNHILETLTNPVDELHFIEAGELLKKEGHTIHPTELSEMYQYIRNFCVRKINQGNSHYVQKLFDIYNDMLNNQQLMKHDYLSQWEYKNIVTISLRLGEINWCAEFIKKYINYLKPQERKNALNYNTAYFYFMNNEFHRAIRKLQEVELTDVFYQLDSRVVMLKSYYELDDWEAFFYQASAFRLFLLRNKSISEYQKTIYRNLIKFLSAIMRSGLSKVKLRRIKAEIEQEKNVADLNWLLKKVDVLL